MGYTSNAVANEPLVTAERLAAEPPPFACELVAGRVVKMSPAGVPHTVVVGLVNAALSRWADQHDAGLVTSGEGGYLVRRDPDSVRAPDVAFLTWETLARGAGAASTYFPTAPDLAVEVLSPADTWLDVEAKVHEYLAAAGRAVWVLNPQSQTVHVFRASLPATVLTRDDALEGGDVLPGFSARVVTLFELPKR